MDIRKWVSLFGKTLLLGAVLGLVLGVIFQWNTLVSGYKAGHVKGFYAQLFNLFVFGGLFSVLSQMGFFAYLTVHRIALGMFRSHSRWGIIQVGLILFVFFDLIFLRYTAFADEGDTIWGYILMPIILIIFALIVAEVKKRETNKIAYIPTIFFMFVVTTLEWIPGLRTGADPNVWVMGLTLVACNAYQVLKLHRLVKES